MSYRRGEDDLLTVIRELESRVRRLEQQTVTVRRNDVRIGDLLIEWQATPPGMILRNLATNLPPVFIAVP